MTPFFWWGGFLGALMAANVCLVVILRKQWVEHERLTFPIAQVMLELTGASGTSGRLSVLVRSRLFQTGFWLVLGLLVTRSARFVARLRAEGNRDPVIISSLQKNTLALIMILLLMSAALRTLPPGPHVSLSILVMMASLGFVTAHQRSSQLLPVHARAESA